MMKWLPKVSLRTVYFHTAAWLVYTLIMYRYNLKNYPDSSVGRIVALVVLLAVVFYAILVLLFWIFQRLKKRRLLGPLFSSALALLLFAWSYVYVLAPLLGWKIYREDLPYSNKQFVANAGRVLKEMGKYAAIYFLFYQHVLKKKRLSHLKANLSTLRRGLQHVQIQGLNAQISPHFMMNAFNSFYAIIYQWNEGLAGRLFRLSEILDYSLDNQNQEGLRTVSLHRELTEMEKLLSAYYGESTEGMPIHLLCLGSTRAFRLPAFTLIGCVENMVKYAVLDVVNKQAVLRVVSAGDSLLITAINGIAQEKKSTISKSSGLIDLRKRLQYLLGNRFLLSHWKEGNLFIFFLYIERH